VIVGIVVLDLLGLIGLAVHRTTTTTTTIHPLAQPVPAPPTNPGKLSLPAGEGPPSGPVTIPVANHLGTGKGTPTRHRTTPTTTHHHAPTPPKSPPGPTAPVTIGKCPVKLAKPDQMGGVQTFVPFAPAFGPFSAEAFAAASAYQPELELLGPILAQYPRFAPQVEPLLKPVLALFGAGSKGLFTLISPLYSPHRTQVLETETKLAAFFAPYSKKLAGQPLSGCVVDLEAALVGDTKSAKGKHHKTGSV
jgi:hypothetical protein